MWLLTGRALLLLALGGGLLLLPGGTLLFGVYLGVLLAALLADAFQLVRAGRDLQIQRVLAAQLGQFEPNAIAYRWRNFSRLRMQVLLRESGTAPFLAAVPQLIEFAALPHGEGNEEAQVTPTLRGTMRFPELRLRLTSPWRLVTWQRRLLQPASVLVVPSLGVIRELAHWARREDVALLGAHRLRRVEQGTNFKELRPYREGDEYRLIDWKSTAKRNQLIVREMEPEKSQNLLLILDLGRSMGTPVDRATRLDYALHTALVLAYVAAMRGDLVGAAAFGGDLRFFAPPRSGRDQVRLLIENLAPLQSEAVEPDYRFSLATVATLVRKRSLVVIFTDVSDPSLNLELYRGLKAISKRHLPFVVTVPDPRMAEALGRPPDSLAAMYHQGAMAEVLNDRAAALLQIERAGGVVVDVPSRELTAAVVGEYIRIKGRNLL